MKTRLVILSGLAALGLGGEAIAHHSAAMFDMTKELTIQGTIKKWNFTAPHSWLTITTLTSDGHTQDWSFEGGGPSGALRQDTFRVGDKVSVKTHPMRDGRPAGTLGPVTFADGHQFTGR